jgi:hypothetical protein
MHGEAGSGLLRNHGDDVRHAGHLLRGNLQNL